MRTPENAYLQVEQTLDWSSIQVLQMRLEELQRAPVEHRVVHYIRHWPLEGAKEAFSTLAEHADATPRLVQAMNDLAGLLESARLLLAHSADLPEAAMVLPEGVVQATSIPPQLEYDYEAAMYNPDQFTDRMFDQVAQVVSSLEQVKRERMLSVSDSHTTTGLVLMAAQKLDYPLKRTAILSFDHHRDVGAIGLEMRKHNVMRHTLSHTDVAGLAVFGDANVGHVPADHIEGKPATFTSGRALYARGKPNTEAFLDAIHETYALWQQQGIEHVYPSVDLDVLRIPTLGYTATDYNTYAELGRIIGDMATREQLQRFLKEPSNPEQQQRMLATVDQLVQNSNLPYFGVPAGWVGKALDTAKQYGITIGVPHTGDLPQLGGDVTEFSGNDVGGRTGRITQALIQRLARSR